MIKNRILLTQKLKQYILNNAEEWQSTKLHAERQNGWFTQAFIEAMLQAICSQYLNEESLIIFENQIITKKAESNPMTIGITMAGNIPLVGFHDFLSVFLSGHIQRIKFSSKDDILLPHLIGKMYEWDQEIRQVVMRSEMLKGCDAYIATGSNNSARYFDYYFAKYPHIIRRNRTSVAILDGTETNEELASLANDVYQYFGLGCRNVTKLYVPIGYDFIPLLQAFNKYDDLKHHNKYRNNYDYNLALFMLNHQPYMSNESILLIENPSVYSAIAVLNYEFYEDLNLIETDLKLNKDIQTIIGHQFLDFGKAQTPSLFDFADGVNTIEFLNAL